MQANLSSPLRIAWRPRHDAPLRGQFPRQGHQGETVHHPPHLGVRAPGQMMARPGYLAPLQRQQILLPQPAQPVEEDPDRGAVGAPGGDPQVVGEGLGGWKPFPALGAGQN